MLYAWRLMGLSTDSSYVYMGDFTQLSAPPSTTWPTPLGTYSSPTPVAVHRLGAYLRTHPDQRMVRYVLQGLQEGFRIGVAENLVIRSSACNHSSSRENTPVAAAQGGQGALPPQKSSRGTHAMYIHLCVRAHIYTYLCVVGVTIQLHLG